MIAPPDPFAQNFDSIEIDPARAPSPAAIERATTLAGEEIQGFHLLDDAGGRFVIDREMGVISLKDKTLLERERGAVHAVRLRVIEPSGARYELDLRLSVTGLVPQMVGAEEDFAFLCETSAPGAVAPTPHVPWTRYAAVNGACANARLDDDASPLGALLSYELPPIGAAPASLALAETPPAPSPAAATWTI